MKRLLVGLAVALVVLAIASSALAGIYAGPQQWAAGQGAGTGYSANWLRNFFSTYGSGYDKTVTFIDNKSYAWHRTVRGTGQTTTTYPPFDGTYKAHCRANVGSFHGSCTVY